MITKKVNENIKTDSMERIAFVNKLDNLIEACRLTRSLNVEAYKNNIDYFIILLGSCFGKRNNYKKFNKKLCEIQQKFKKEHGNKINTHNSGKYRKSLDERLVACLSYINEVGLGLKTTSSMEVKLKKEFPEGKE